MELYSEKAQTSTSSSAAATIQKLYSAQELAVLMNTKPLELMDLDIGYQTRWYDCEFIESMLRYIELEPNIEILMSLIIVRWRRQVDEHQPKVSYYDVKSRSWLPYVENLPEKLNVVLEKVKAYRKHKEEERQMEERWRLMFENGVEAPPLHIEVQVDTDYRLDDLPNDVRNQILIDDDILYSDFVKTLKGPVKIWIDKHNLKDWNVVRFICRLRGIVARKCSLKIFGKLLEKIGLGNQENNMKQRQDANNDNFLKDYDDKRKKQNFWQLKRDGEAIEKELKPIIDKLSA